jgi:TPR repeat protein
MSSPAASRPNLQSGVRRLTEESKELFRKIQDSADLQAVDGAASVRLFGANPQQEQTQCFHVYQMAMMMVETVLLFTSH